MLINLTKDEWETIISELKYYGGSHYRKIEDQINRKSLVRDLIVTVNGVAHTFAYWDVALDFVREITAIDPLVKIELFS